MTERPFEALGLSADADRAYPLLVATRGVAAAELARNLGVSPDLAASACGELAARGLARQGADGLWYPLPPQAGLLPMVTRAEEQLRRGRLLLDRLGTVYQRVHEDVGPEEVVRAVRGEAAVRRQVEQVHAGAREELLFLSRGPGLLAADHALSGAGVGRRVLVERGALDVGPGDVGPGAEGVRVRMVERVPVRMCVADRSVALLPLADDARQPDPALLVVRPSGVLDGLVALFESLWAAAVPLGPPDSGVRLRILGMLAGGSTDAAMARALGIAVRTVQRHIAALQRAAGADNRVQLVWHAARHGWLDP